MEKSLEFRGIIEITPYSINLRYNDDCGSVDLAEAIYAMFGINKEKYGTKTFPAELYITANILDRKFKINEEDEINGNT